MANLSIKLEAGLKKPLSLEASNIKGYGQSRPVRYKDLIFSSLIQASLHFDIDVRILRNLINDSQNEDWEDLANEKFASQVSKPVVVDLSHYFVSIFEAAAFFKIKISTATDNLAKKSNWKLFENLTKQEKDSIPDLDEKIKKDAAVF